MADLLSKVFELGAGVLKGFTEDGVERLRDTTLRTGVLSRTVASDQHDALLGTRVLIGLYQKFFILHDLCDLLDH